MGDLDRFDAEPDETTWMSGRMPDHTYLSRTFPLRRPASDDDGQPARFMYKVFDDDGMDSVLVETEGTSWTLSTSPAGRAQVKILLAREGDHIKDLWIQRLKETKDGPKAGSVLHLGSTDAEALLEMFRNLKYVPIQGEFTTRVDDALIRRVFADPNALAAYDLDSDVLRVLIEQDANARDVIATAGRRTIVQQFRQMLEDKDYFDDLKTQFGVRGDEAVWQRFFEENPWILGVSLTGQLLTSWDRRKLEQVVAGYSVNGSGKRADALLRTAGAIQSMVFAEFKTASTPLLEARAYRPDCWAPSRDLVGGVVQAQGTVHTAVSEVGDRIASLADDGSEIPGDLTYLFQPRSFLVVGSLSQFIGEAGGHNTAKVRSFELFRRSTTTPEIVTFDELLARAEWMTGLISDADASSTDGASVEVPF